MIAARAGPARRIRLRAPAIAGGRSRRTLAGPVKTLAASTALTFPTQAGLNTKRPAERHQRSGKRGRLTTSNTLPLAETVGPGSVQPPVPVRLNRGITTRRASGRDAVPRLVDFGLANRQ